MISLRGDEVEALKGEFIEQFLTSMMRLEMLPQRLFEKVEIELLKESSAWALLFEKAQMGDCCQDG